MQYPKMIYRPNGKMVEYKGKLYDYKVINNESELNEALNGGYQIGFDNSEKIEEENEQVEIELEEQVFELKQETENKEPVKRRGRPRKA